MVCFILDMPTLTHAKEGGKKRELAGVLSAMLALVSKSQTNHQQILP